MALIRRPSSVVVCRQSTLSKYILYIKSQSAIFYHIACKNHHQAEENNISDFRLIGLELWLPLQHIHKRLLTGSNLIFSLKL